MTVQKFNGGVEICLVFRSLLCPVQTLVLLAAIGMNLSCDADDWPGWRGPLRNGVTADTGAPTTWSETENIVWKTPLPGVGISNPVVWGDRVIVTASEGTDHADLHVVCLDRLSGRERWHRRLWGTAPSLFYPHSGMASPSPVTDGERLFAFFGTGDVFCFDLDGGLLWQRALSHEYGRFQNRFAASSSPILFKGKLILQCDHYGDSYVIALDPQTGANLWKTDRPEAWHSWSSPQMMETSDHHELVLSGSKKLDAYDPVSGIHLWTVGGLAQECIPTPVFGHGLLYAVSGPNGHHFAVRPGGHGDVTKSHVVWKHRRGTSFVPSALVVDDRYYLVDDKGFARCWSIPSGEVLWRKRFKGKYTASPVSADGKLFFVNEAGSTLVLDATSHDYVELSRNEIGEDVLSSPAIAGGSFFLRSSEQLYRIGENP
jgi:outer membrane protein assembly factor BamB